MELEREHGVGEHLWEDVGQLARGHDPQVPGETPPPPVAAPRVRKAPSPVCSEIQLSIQRCEYESMNVTFRSII